MDKLIVNGGNRLHGEIKVSGAKNVAMKVVLAGLLTDDVINVENVPEISSVKGTVEIVRKLGVKVTSNTKHTLTIRGNSLKYYQVPLDIGGFYRTGTMVMGPLLARFGKAVVPNPGGCRIGKRPIDRHIEGLKLMGAKITYRDGYFFAEANKLKGIYYRFNSNTHTGTETLILAAVMAQGDTVIENAAEEPEIDDLIRLLNQMGARIKRGKNRIISIKGVRKLKGTDFAVMPDRNEAVTFGIAAITTGGDLIVDGAQKQFLEMFLKKLDESGAGWESLSLSKIRFYGGNKLKATRMTTTCHPGFMTDWQAPWALLMTQAKGISLIHETVYEDRFGYVGELLKMGAKIEFADINVKDPVNFYNFNWTDRVKGSFHALKIHGPSKLHDAILEVSDLRAGATLLLGALAADGESVISGIDHIDRGYETIEDRLVRLGARIVRTKV